ncbi:XdhC family protein [Halomonas organivorans]|uniref:Xanthine dehydrogenase accessory factor n=1 Tax=Halomonas organivorans TaxID=257772 RepID=A0A7W5BYZ1_9GAMM|nr:XdhC family protein [Halomonas organivorans]MBB3141607.1 xanthine dehydrogenase accessory factor [Halomonas organivorans]
MPPLDLITLERALEWARRGETVWLCSVLSTYGSSPRPPGALLAATQGGEHSGSLSGGCVEDDFLARLAAGEFDATPRLVRYGADDDRERGIRLPCGGQLDVLVERLAPGTATEALISAMLDVLRGAPPRLREVSLIDGESRLVDDAGLGPRVERAPDHVRLRLAPAHRLIIAGISPVSRYCAQFARALDFDVIVCDPRADMCHDFDVADVRVIDQLPSSVIPGASHGGTAVVALTHDPRIDDLAMIEAVRTPAFYIGVMGSRQTSAARAERLRRSGGLGDEDIARLRMPIGLDIGSRTPAEIALAVMADIVATQRGSRPATAPHITGRQAEPIRPR